MARPVKTIDPEIIGRVRAERLPVHDIQALAGVGAVRAQRIQDEAGLPAFPASGYVEVPVWQPPQAGEVVDLFPSDKEVALPMFVAGDDDPSGVSLYLRSHSLAQPLWRSATYAGTDEDRRVRVRPILARAVIADGRYRPHFADKTLNKRVKRTWNRWADFIEDRWGGPADVLVLGDVLPDIDLPLGWEGGIAGVRHVFLDDLRSASQLKGVETAKI